MQFFLVFFLVFWMFANLCCYYSWNFIAYCMLLILPALTLMFCTCFFTLFEIKAAKLLAIAVTVTNLAVYHSQKLETFAFSSFLRQLCLKKLLLLSFFRVKPVALVKEHPDSSRESTWSQQFCRRNAELQCSRNTHQMEKKKKLPSFSAVKLLAIKYMWCD